MISDIDDTILLTGLTEGVAMVARTVLREASQRAAIPDGLLYRGLARGIPTPTGNRKPRADVLLRLHRKLVVLPDAARVHAVARISSGSDVPHRLGPTERYLRRSGAEHKRTAIRRLIEAYPEHDVRHGGRQRPARRVDLRGDGPEFPDVSG